MKAILEFNLPEEYHEHLVAAHASDFTEIIRRMELELRGWLKQGHNFKDADEALEKVRDKLWDEINERGVEPLLGLN